MWRLLFYVVAALAYGGIRDLVFYLIDPHCKGLCGVLVSAFIFIVVVFGLFNWIHKQIFAGKHIFG
jgi:hypothetical protein